MTNEQNEGVNTAGEDILETKGRRRISLHQNESYRRVSLAIPHLLHTRRKVEGEEDEQDTVKDPSVY